MKLTSPYITRIELSYFRTEQIVSIRAMVINGKNAMRVDLENTQPCVWHLDECPATDAEGQQNSEVTKMIDRAVTDWQNNLSRMNLSVLVRKKMLKSRDPATGESTVQRIFKKFFNKP